eukprot:PhM_4_TR17255/c0_g1_i1/m.56773
MVTFGGSFMDRLIFEANSKFTEKAQLVTQDQTVSFSAFTDRSYNLRVQMAGTAWLANDTHFMEMLMFVEKFTAVDDNLRGDLDKRLNAVLAGLLKGLLRESLSLPDIGGKKISLERVHAWYQEKTFELLDAKMKRRAAIAKAKQHQPQQQQVHATVVDESPLGAGEAGLQRSPSKHHLTLGEEATTVENISYEGPRGRWVQAMAAEGPPAPVPSSPGGVSSIASPRFSRGATPQAGQQPMIGANLAQGPSITFLQRKKEQETRAVIDRKMHTYRKPNLSKPRGRPCEQQKSDHAATPEPAAQRPQPRIVYKNRPKSATGNVYMHAKSSGDARVDAGNESAHRVWVMRRIQQLENAFDENEMKDCLTMWQQNYARLEEESNRRVEGSQVASQMGRTCHAQFLVKESARSTAEPAKLHPSRTRQPSLVGGGGEGGGVGSTTVSSSLDGVAIPRKFEGTDVSFSPYDAYRTTMLDKILHDYQDNNTVDGQRVRAPDSALMARLGLRASHTPTLRSTAPLNVPIDMLVSDETVVAPALVPAIDKPFMEQMFPRTDANRTDGPSVLRLQQLQLASRVHECFSRSRTKEGQPMRQSMASIQKALLTPEDMPLDECLMMLPRPDQGYIRDYTGASKKAGGKKAKKKSAKKAKAK